jgi:hypothetical protein
MTGSSHDGVPAMTGSGHDRLPAMTARYRTIVARVNFRHGTASNFLD